MRSSLLCVGFRFSVFRLFEDFLWTFLDRSIPLRFVRQPVLLDSPSVVSVLCLPRRFPPLWTLPCSAVSASHFPPAGAGQKRDVIRQPLDAGEVVSARVEKPTDSSSRATVAHLIVHWTTV